MRAEDESTKVPAHVSRRRLLQISAATGMIAHASHQASSAEAQPVAVQRSAQWRKAVEELESYFTPQDEFRDVSRGRPVPHRLPEETKSDVGLTRETWRLQVLADPDNPASLQQPFSEENQTAFRFEDLMSLAKEKSVRFAKVMTCLNIGCPLGMGVWEGVPLREVIWQTQPKENLRRIFYYGYHNDDPKQMFRSSLPVGRVLEDPYDLPPVILCYKLNGQWLSSERGGPVRVVVPEAYGFKSIKWLSHIYLSNLPHANDTYAEKNNDVDSPLKSFAATLSIPEKVSVNEPFVVSGYAQAGIAGLKQVQVSLHNTDEPVPPDDPSFGSVRCYNRLSWQEAEILGPPEDWGGQMGASDILPDTMGFKADGQPQRWPMRLAKAHWIYECSGLPAGKYTFRSRTIDEQQHAQPMPRPFRKSGHAAIEQKTILVQA